MLNHRGLTDGSKTSHQTLMNKKKQDKHEQLNIYRIVKRVTIHYADFDDCCLVLPVFIHNIRSDCVLPALF